MNRQTCESATFLLPYLTDWKCSLHLQEPIPLQELERSFNTKVFLMRPARSEQEKDQGKSIVELVMGHCLLSPAKIFVGQENHLP